MGLHNLQCLQSPENGLSCLIGPAKNYNVAFSCSSRNFFGIYCHANFYRYANFSIALGQYFKGRIGLSGVGKQLEGGAPPVEESQHQGGEAAVSNSLSFQQAIKKSKDQRISVIGYEVKFYCFRKIIGLLVTIYEKILWPLEDIHLCFII